MRIAVKPVAIPEHCFHVRMSRSARCRPTHMAAVKAPIVTRMLRTAARMKAAAVAAPDGVLGFGGGKLMLEILAAGCVSKL
jgi:hypothetical protein